MRLSSRSCQHKKTIFLLNVFMTFSNQKTTAATLFLSQNYFIVKSEAQILAPRQHKSQQQLVLAQQKQPPQLQRVQQLAQHLLQVAMTKNQTRGRICDAQRE